MKKAIFKGTATALVTPFKEDGAIDFNSLKKIIDHQIDKKIEALLICGSTGESATLSAKEKMSLYIQAVEYSAGRVPVIAGTGSNNTQASIDMTLLAKEHGADAALLVAPYYNKPSQEGLLMHYRAIAETVDIPQIIYNVPGRSGVNISAETQLRLAEECENIVATKEASGDLEQMMEIIRNAPEGFVLYSGDDALTLPISAIGGEGVISVISNYAPKEFGDAVRDALTCKIETAKEKHFALMELMKLNFIETNPVPVKTAMSIIGLCGDTLRLPLVEMQPENKKNLTDAIIAAGIKA